MVDPAMIADVAKDADNSPMTLNVTPAEQQPRFPR
jgi:hypothetical protein